MHKILEMPSKKRRDEFLAAAKRSRRLHSRWVSAPGTPEEFDAYLRSYKQSNRLGYWIVTETDQLAGVINISQIVGGFFQSGYLGYYAFTPHESRGYMSEGLRAVITRAFRTHGLHRLEANIQPENRASKRLVERLGFRLEGFSPRYLKIAGRWRDHERWAITAEEWPSARHHPAASQPRKFSS